MSPLSLAPGQTKRLIELPRPFDFVAVQVG